MNPSVLSPLRLASSRPAPSDVRAPVLDAAPRLWPTDKVRAVLLEASVSQCFAGRRILEPVVRALVARGYFCFGDLLTLTREQIFAGTPEVFRVRLAFIRELEALGFVFSSEPRPVRRWRRRIA
ncbi:hypothetical protein GIW81_08530 [Hyphomicrobium sp. xq]|uniref:Uncharacterized protein n=1 Tax=Hyphomicrobium album TaxID=2665159 RepID=A0A6I3KIY9_9HYPH|nr:hypothetical protein [Hyphomicrobium album]MTD94378.1 hypothetical protein [Hyphomicrobium album]